MMGNNNKMYEQRLSRLAQRAAVYLAELNEANTMTKTHLEEWMALRYQNECSAVTAGPLPHPYTPCALSTRGWVTI